MKSRYLTIVPVFVALSLALAAGNLLRNPEFEDPGATIWANGGTGDAIGGVDRSVSHTGNASGVIRKTLSLDSHVAALYQTVPVEPDTEYFQSAWVKGTGTLFAYLYDANGNYITQTNPAKVCSAGWVPVVNRLKTTKETRFVNYRFEIYARGVPGEGWLDNARLVAVAEVPSAPEPVTELKAEKTADGGVGITWSNGISPKPVQYLIFRSRYPDLTVTGVPYAMTTERQFHDGALPAGWPRVYYRVMAVDDFNQAGKASDLAALTLKGDAVPEIQLRTADAQAKIRRYGDIPSDIPAEPALTLALAGNEVEAGQIVVTAQNAPLVGLDAKIAPFYDEAGNPATGFTATVKRVDYVPLEHPTFPVEPGLWPDPLSDWNAPVDVPQDANQAIWIEIAAAATSRAGTYNSSVTLTGSGGWQAEIPLRVTRYGFDIPRKPSFSTVFELWEGNLAGYYGIENDAAARKKVHEKFYWFLVDRRLTPDKLPVPPDSEEAKRFLDDERVTCFMLPTPFWKDVDEAGLKRAADTLRSEGYLSKGYVYNYDEPTEAQYPRCRELSQAVHKAGADIRFLLTEPPHPELAGYVDIWCPVLHEIEWDKVVANRREGDEFWWYNCAGPMAPYVTYYLDDIGVAPRALQWLQFKYHVTGLLYWCVNYWPTDVWRNPLNMGAAMGAGNGEGFLIYPGPDGSPVSSLRLEAIREGCEDFEYLTLLHDRLVASGMTPEEAQRRVEALIEPLARTLTDWERDSTPYLKQREKIAHLIESLPSKENSPENGSLPEKEK